MYINSVLSFVGAWQRLQESHQLAFQELEQAFASIDHEALIRYIHYQRGSVTIDEPAIRPKEMAAALKQELIQQGWDTDIATGLGLGSRNHPITVDLGIGGVGVELGLAGRRLLLERHIFVKFPLIARVPRFQVLLLLVPMRSLVERMRPRVCRFGLIRNALKDLSPLPFRNSFAVLGFSGRKASLKVEEMTSSLDLFLIDTIGLSLDEMLLVHEQSGYDFKLELPSNKKLAQEACAFANRRGGGLILLGIGEDGSVHGLPKGRQLDQVQLQVTNVICDGCLPAPEFELHAFDTPADPTRAILVIQVSELAGKPCMTTDRRVYLRYGPSARPAGPEEIRRMILE